MINYLENMLTIFAGVMLLLQTCSLVAVPLVFSNAASVISLEPHVFLSGCGHYATKASTEWITSLTGAPVIIGTMDGPLYKLKGDDSHSPCRVTHRMSECFTVATGATSKCDLKNALNVTPKAISGGVSYSFENYFFFDTNLGNEAGIILKGPTLTDRIVKAMLGKGLLERAIDGFYINNTAEITGAYIYAKNVRLTSVKWFPTTKGLIMGATKIDLLLHELTPTVPEVIGTTTVSTAMCVTMGQSVPNHHTMQAVKRVENLRSQCYVSSVNSLKIISKRSLLDGAVVYVGTLYEHIDHECIVDSSRRLMRWGFLNHVKAEGCIVQSACTILIDLVQGVVTLTADNIPAYVSVGYKGKVITVESTYRIHLPDKQGHLYIECGPEVKSEYFIRKTSDSCLGVVSKFTWIPTFLATSVCTHPILLAALIILLIAFLVLYLIVETFAGFILGLACYPCITGFYRALDKYWYKCHGCGLNKHLGTCPKYCTCGKNFSSTDFLHIHTQSERCTRKIFRSYKLVLSMNTVKLLFAIILVVIVTAWIPIATASVNPEVVVEKAALIECSSSDDDVCFGGELSLDIPAVTGSYVNYNVHFANGVEYGVMHLEVLRAGFWNNYEIDYKTGKTVEYQVKHSETCTGTCPSEVEVKTKLNMTGMVFKKERTSRWGCEQFGCLAINTGCLYGVCHNLILADHFVFKKQNSIDQQAVTMSYTFGKIDELFNLTDNAMQTDTLRLSVDFQDSIILSGIFLQTPDGHCHVGAINPFGAFARQCGDIQLKDGIVYGQGLVNWDYICHNVSPKDVIVTGCYADNFAYCKLLEELDPILHQFDGEKMFVHARSGTVRARLTLGDLRLADYTDSSQVQLSAESTCTGCYLCQEGFRIQLSITSSTHTSCRVEVDKFVLMTNRLLISQGTAQYTIHGYSTTELEPFEITLCRSKLMITCTLKKTKNAYYGLLNSGVAAYRSKESNSCVTWLCKLGFEISSLFWGLSIYWIIVVIILILLIPVFIKLAKVWYKWSMLGFMEFKKSA